jgi:protein-tyrosine kinase
MSTFFKALEQAEKERAQKEQTHREDVGSPPSAPPPASAPQRTAPVTPARPIAEAPSPPLTERRPSRSPIVQPPPAAVRPEVASRPWKEIDEHLVSLLDPASFESEQYRVLRHSVEQLRRTSGLSVFAVSSPAVGDGKTLTAVNLAGSLAQGADARVLLVDADLRHAAVGSRLGLDEDEGPGLVDAILDTNVVLEDVVRRRPPYNLSVLSAGRLATAPYEVLKSPRLGELLDQARARYDYILLDTPPVLPVPDCRIIGKWVDGFILVVTAHRTPRRMVEEALNLMESSKVIGLVFNGDDQPISTYNAAYARRLEHGRAWWGRAAKTMSVRRTAH